MAGVGGGFGHLDGGFDGAVCGGGVEGCGYLLAIGSAVTTAAAGEMLGV